jgi:TRAP-type C4-dicarboxylate transport system permease small subunit
LLAGRSAAYHPLVGDKQDEPPARESHLSIENIPAQFPDDGPVARWARLVDNTVGRIELAILLALLVTVVIVASMSALSDHVFHYRIGLWWTWVVRKGTFAIAMFGAAYATQQQRLLAMDLVSKGLSPRARLVLGVVLKLFTIAIACVFVYTGLNMHDRANHGAGPKLDLTLFRLSEKDALTVIPIGGALIILHSLLHAIIEAEYFARGKLLPERVRTGH